MSDKQRTVEQWLHVPDQDLPVTLAEALVKKPWKHKKDPNAYRFTSCIKCLVILETHLSPKYCTVPDPIKIDETTARYYLDKAIAGVPLQQLCGPLLVAMREIWEIRRVWSDDMWKWWALYATAADKLIAAAMTAEGAEKEVCPLNNDEQGDVYDNSIHGMRP